MKLRALVLALASASTALPNSAHAADDLCSRLIVQAVNQFCQLLPNGLNLCQPVALVGPGPECAMPERQALVPLGPPALQPLAPWAAPYASRPWPANPMTSLPPWKPAWTSPVAPAVTAPHPPAPPPDLPRIMAEMPKPIIATAPAPLSAPATTATTVEAKAPLPPLAGPAAATTATVVMAPLPAAAVAATPVPFITPVAAPVPAAAVAEPAPATVAMAVTPVPANVPQADLAATQPATPGVEAAAVDALAHFDFDSANLTVAGRAVLDAWLAEAPRDKPVRVSGHADRLGPVPYNLNLSLRRAEAVKQYLVGKGIDSRTIQLEAKGESEPVKRCKGGATPTAKACLAPNRRVQITPE